MNNRSTGITTHSRALLTLAIGLLCLVSGLGAQTPARSTRVSAYFPAGDAQRGENLAMGCVACHKAAVPPLGDPPVHAPSLRHQRASAIFYALQDYRSGQRHDPVMRPIAASLDDQQMRDLAIYLAGKPAPIPKASLTGAHDQAASVCAFCHGETGLGEMDGYPVLAGQYLDYLDKAFSDYRTGSRSNPTMSAIARKFTAQQAHDLAAYYASYSALEPIPLEAPSP